MSLEAVVRRDRLVVLTGLMLVTALAWGYLLREAGVMSDMALPEMGATVARPHTVTWRLFDLAVLFAMWTIMMVAMMLPSAVPMVLTFATVNRRRAELRGPFVPTSIFVLGYLAVWTAFSAAATLAQWGLHEAALLSAAMVGTSPWLAGGLLIGAGLFQWTPLKDACLRHCRSPLGFLVSEWRDGRRGALTMGWRHGAYCLGCCWALMALLFVLGVMNLLWIAALAGFVLVEKLVPETIGPWVSRAAGVLLVGWGIWAVAA